MSNAPPLTPQEPTPADELLKHLSSLNQTNPSVGRHVDQPLTDTAINQAFEALARDFLLVQDAFANPAAKGYTPLMWQSLKTNLINALCGPYESANLHLREEMALQAAENLRLREEIKSKNSDNLRLREEIKCKNSENLRMREEIKSKNSEILTLSALNTTLTNEKLVPLQARVERLRKPCDIIPANHDWVAQSQIVQPDTVLVTEPHLSFWDTWGWLFGAQLWTWCYSAAQGRWVYSAAEGRFVYSQTPRSS